MNTPLEMCPTYREDGARTAGFKCMHCEQWTPQSKWDEWLGSSGRSNIECECGNTLTNLSGSFDKTRASLGVRENDYHLYASSEDVATQTWYHVSKRKNWLKKFNETSANGTLFFPHVGTLDTVNDLIFQRNLYNDDIEPWYLYEVTIKPGVVLHPGYALEDKVTEDAWARLMKAGKADVVRYVNMYESPGSISLIANPYALQTTCRLELTDFDPWQQHLSEYLEK